MNNIYHICYTSHKEVFCRNHNDYFRLINSIAQAAFKTGTSILAYTIMSNHVHLAVMTDHVVSFVKSARKSYTFAFNHIYSRKGCLGERGYYCLQIEGRNHITAAISYILRNPIHHNVSENPFCYPFSSINQYFSHFNNDTVDKKIIPIPTRQKTVRLMRKKNVLPDNIGTDSRGLIYPSSFVEKIIVESYFGTYYNLQYNLHRRNYADWEEEQKKEDVLKVSKRPISLGSIEPYFARDEIVKMENRFGRWGVEERVSDIKLCEIIDSFYIPKLNKTSYTELTHLEKELILKQLVKQFRPVPGQIMRCLGWDYGT